MKPFTVLTCKLIFLLRLVYSTKPGWVGYLLTPARMSKGIPTILLWGTVLMGIMRYPRHVGRCRIDRVTKGIPYLPRVGKSISNGVNPTSSSLSPKIMNFKIQKVSFIVALVAFQKP